MRGELTTALRRALPAALLFLAAAAAAAQDPVPRDTLPRPVPADTLRRPPKPGGEDTLRVPIPDEARRTDTLPDLHGDSARADTLPPDSAVAAPNFPDFPQLPTAGFGPGVWVWSQSELARWHGLSLQDFFDRIPGLVVTRSGSSGRSTGASPYGGGGGRVRIYLDGWELRAMNGGTADLQRVPLSDVVALRVERGLGEVRVDVSTFRLSDRRPYGKIEGADGDFNTRILRPFYAQPWGRRVVVQLGMDLVETNGFRRAENFGAGTPFARLSYQIRPELALQLDYRSTSWSLDPSAFTGNTLPGEQLDRSELMLRGRGHFGRLWLDAAVGRSQQDPAEGDSVVAELRSVQGYARAALDLGVGSLIGTARVHQGEAGSWAPDERELGVAAYFSPIAGLSAGGNVRHRTRDGEGGLALEGWARAALVGGLAAFGSVASGEQAVTFLRDSIRVVSTIGGAGGLPGVPLTDTLAATFFRTAVPSLRAFRAGGEWSRGPWSLGAAYVAHDLDQVVPYGAYFDAGFEPVDGGTLTAVEGYGSVPLFWDALRVEGWFMSQLGDVGRPYLPRYFGRGALELHDVYRAGNLEPTLRLEVLGRGRAPLPDGAEAPRYLVANAFVQVRILDIRLFWRMDNLFNNRQALDVTGTRLPGAIQMYGVRWFFRN